ncbi:MAG: methyltransferase [Anaerolineales bacterium]|nr:methyltransferase [Anaerolineales bacterium]
MANSDNPQQLVSLTHEATFGLGELHIFQPPGSFSLTPASRIAVQAIGQHQQLLAGTGLDWGSGTGCLAIAAAKVPDVKHVIGLELTSANVQAAQHNAQLNGVADRVTCLQSDSYTPQSKADRAALNAQLGQIDFILANPPSSEGDDGFGFRREVLRGGRPFLKPDGLVLLNISYQYGAQRIAALCQQIAGFSHEGVLASTGWVPFDLQRADLRQCLHDYAAEEQRGGFLYEFAHPQNPATVLNAQAALAHFQQTGQSPLSQWQTHLFKFMGKG